MECNAIRYMSGYAAISLLKKYRKSTKHPKLKVKWEQFVHVLTGMKAVDQPGEPGSLLDYTKLWAELIDRGGLYHINDEVSGQFYIAYMFLNLYVCTNMCLWFYVKGYNLQVYHLIESIELVARLHLNIQNVQVSTPGTNIRKVMSSTQNPFFLTGK